MQNPYVDAIKQILKLTVKHQKFFEKNPKPLAYLMGVYDEIHYASRFDENEELHDWENPKYPIIDLERTVGQKYADLVYDAWGFGMHLREKGDSKTLPLENRMNKTMDDWLAICLNPKHRYHSLYPTRFRVYDHLLCTIGNGMGWNKDGFLTHDGPCGTDLDIYNGAERAFLKLPKPICNKILSWRADPIISKGLKKQKIAIRKQQKEQESLELFSRNNPPKEITQDMDARAKAKFLKLWKKIKRKTADQFDLKKLPHQWYPMSEEYSRLMTMPENVHESYIKAGIEICEDILANPEHAFIEHGGKKYPSDNPKIAKKFLAKYARL